MEKTKKSLAPHWKKQLLRLGIVLLLAALGFLWPIIAAAAPRQVEMVYARHIYPAIKWALCMITGWFPFSLAQWLLFAAILCLLFLIVWGIVTALRRKMTVLRLVRTLLSLLMAAAILFNAFYLLWGLNYHRPGVATLMELTVKDRPVAELEALCHALTEDAKALRTELSEDEQGVFWVEDMDAAFKNIQQTYLLLGEELPFTDGRVNRPKSVLGSRGLSWAGIAGIFMPFTGEPNVNVHQPYLLRLSSAAHECAHSLGISRENDANFLAYLVCTRSSDAAVRYSGTMMALIYCANQLYRVDPDAYSALVQTYSEGMRRDLTHHNTYWKAHEGPVEEVMSSVNDSYLKYNHQQSGIGSYGEMVDLLLAYCNK